MTLSQVTNQRTHDKFVEDSEGNTAVRIKIDPGQVSTITPPSAITGYATSSKQDTLLTELQLKADLTETQPVSLTSVPSHAVTNAGTFATQATLQAGSATIGKLAANSGVDIGDVDVTSIATGTNTIGRVGHDITGIGHGVTTVTTAGTDVVLGASIACKRVTIQAQTDNTNLIAVGAMGVDSTAATGTGIALYPGDIFELEIDNLADIYIDSLVNGEGVRYTYFT